MLVGLSAGLVQLSGRQWAPEWVGVAGVAGAVVVAVKAAGGVLHYHYRTGSCPCDSTTIFETRHASMYMM